MSETETASRTQRIAVLVRTLLAKHDIHADPAPDADLRAAGLTSLDMVNLTLAVEGEFDVFIPAEQMTPEHFRSISTLGALVSGLEPA
jgi:acyl carrier protein